MSSRLLVQTIRSNLRSSLLRNQLVKSTITAPRLFSSGIIRKNENRQQLHEVLSQELKFEENDAFGLDESFKTYLEENKIEIINTDGKVLAELVKKTANETIHIYFDILRITQTSFELKQLQEQADNADYLDEEMQDIGVVDVNVVVVKDTKATGFDLALSLTDSSFSISAITNFEDAKIALDDSPVASSIRDLKYSGPEFTNLAEELQESFNQYLNSRGINSSLADFILAYAGVKENNEYLDWLSNLKKFTA
ncbi:Mitochondrial acidic protein mam33 [Pichia californica]|uniref:Mitochondrial acidic protein mam33 n=1 Tax=Pichia californica TaxID=460514 RepID=A0A9P7BEM7_9ASCO|nr:Mitochondrial acidic protein mam33 [[Candida] californica]KAG0688036.1 Mitochondrial acidic protein mam33 [[Candida] californica]